MVFGRVIFRIFISFGSSRWRQPRFCAMARRAPINWSAPYPAYQLRFTVFPPGWWGYVHVTPAYTLDHHLGGQSDRNAERIVIVNVLIIIQPCNGKKKTSPSPTIAAALTSTRSSIGCGLRIGLRSGRGRSSKRVLQTRFVFRYSKARRRSGLLGW